MYLRLSLIVAVLSALLVPRPAAAASGPCRILAFGDSITWGAYASYPSVPAYLPNTPIAAHRVSPEDTTYPGDIARTLHTSVCNYGVPGEAVMQGRWRLHTLLRDYRPERLILLEGVNDLPIPRTPQQIVVDLAAMREDALKHHIAVTMATLTPTYYAASSPKHYLNAAVHRVDVLLRRWAGTHHVPLADLEHAFLADRRGRALTADRLHPNDAGYRIIARAIERVIHTAHT